MIIQTDNLADGKVVALLNEHLTKMKSLSPAESVHALDESTIKQQNLQFFSARIKDEIAGCGALLAHSAKLAEIKSMKTSTQHLRKGVAQAILTKIIAVARESGFDQLSLETGTASAFNPAHKLYHNAGFVPCGPFANYQADPHSRFMTLQLK